MTYPDGSFAAYAWDKNNRLVEFRDIMGTTRYQYNESGQLTKRTFPNGINTHYAYNQSNQLENIRHIVICCEITGLGNC